MIHKYRYMGANIVLDVNSGSVHVVDDIAYDILDFSETSTAEEISVLSEKYNRREIIECLDELNELKKHGRLFSDLVGVSPKKPVVKALCLHIAHDCNLKCKYCFAGEGRYHGSRSLMNAETGKAAIDFIVESSENRNNLEIDFFGGEPTINFDVVKEIVLYAGSKNKNFRFTLTTNGVLVTDDIIDFCNEHMHNIVLSIDGRKEVNDAMRPDKAGNGSYEKIAENIKYFLEKRRHTNYYVRGTFTPLNLDFSNDVLHLADLGFKRISIEPVVSQGEMAILEEHVPAILNEYDTLTKIMCERSDFEFFHFNIDLTGGSCIYKRISGCGAGSEYLSVTPEGGLYPCHQFAGIQQFKLGTVFDGIDNMDLSRKFQGVNVLSKDACASCWAKFYCSGGCAANSYMSGGDISSNYDLGCILQRKRIECAIYLKLRNGGLI